jgi:uncharacterized protein (DUF4415 family)
MNKQEETKITRITLAEAKKKGLRGKTDWARVDALTDEQIEEAVRDDPDAAPLVDKSFWDDASIFNPPEKVEVHMYLDKRVLDFFKRDGRGYQTRINAALCALVDSWYEKHPS